MGDVTHTYTGTVVLADANNTYSGGTTVASGTLVVNIAGALPASRALIIGAGGRFIFDPDGLRLADDLRGPGRGD